MPSLGSPVVGFWSDQEFDAQAREERKHRIVSLLGEGLPVPQGRIFELLRLLSEPVFDLTCVTRIVRSEPLLNTHVSGFSLSLSSSGVPARHVNISECVVMLGSERLRILALGCAIAQFASRRLALGTMRDFWQHSILTALLSERIAREAHPESLERAYLAGLLHDIGRLPLLIAAREQGEVAKIRDFAQHDQPQSERAYFGFDHNEVGRWMALSANLPAWMVDVLAHHHDCPRAIDDPVLVSIVAAADAGSQLPPTGSALTEDSTWRAHSLPFGVN